MTLFPFVGGLAAAGYTAYLAYRGVRKVFSMAAGRGSDRSAGASPAPGRRAAEAVSRGKYWSRRQGWDLDRIPFDLAPSISGDSMLLYKKGYDQAIAAMHRRDGSADFTFVVDDGSAAARVSEHISKSGSAAQVRRMGDGGFMVVSSSPEEASRLLGVACPLSKVEVAGEVHSVNQYRVGGCATFEEALAKFRSMKEDGALGAPEHACIYEVREAAGQRRTDGEKPCPPVSLNAGEWIVNDEKVDAYRCEVTVAGTDRSDAALHAISSMDMSASESVPSKSAGSRLSNGAEDVSRTVEDSHGRSVALVRAASMPAGLSVLVRCSSLAEVQSVLTDGRIPQGRLVEIGRDMQCGAMDVLLPADSERIGRLALQSGASPSQARFNVSVGVTESDLLASEVLAAAAAGETMTLRVKEDLPLDGGLSGGTSLKDLSERLSSQRLAALDEESARLWTEDAARIQSVRMDVDLKSMELRVSSKVDDVMKVETRKLSEEDVRAFERRGTLSQAEMKDVLMQLHPDYFRSYSSAAGRETVHDPLSDMIAGRPPLTTTQYWNQKTAQAKAQTRAQSQKAQTMQYQKQNHI